MIDKLSKYFKIYKKTNYLFLNNKNEISVY